MRRFFILSDQLWASCCASWQLDAKERKSKSHSPSRNCSGNVSCRRAGKLFPLSGPFPLIAAICDAVTDCQFSRSDGSKPISLANSHKNLLRFSMLFQYPGAFLLFLTFFNEGPRMTGFGSFHCSTTSFHSISCLIRKEKEVLVSSSQAKTRNV